MKILNNKGPAINPCGTLNNISLQELCLPFILTPHFVFGRSLCINFKDFLSKPYASSLAIKAHEAYNRKLSIDR